MTESQAIPESCLLCASGVKIRHAAQPGYRLGSTFRILHCPTCDTSFAHPMAVDSSIYDAIYANPDQISGYDRYARYAQAVLEVPDPLAYLAESEDVYWAMRSCVEGLKPGARILEVGSGLGYMTYALLKAGHDVTGMDVSKVAVDNATARYGPHYQEADLAVWSVEKAGQFDMVLMAELIEHLPDPLTFMRMAAQLLRPGGRLVVTTPNKSHYPAWMLWESDPPPVHLWWFSETSMRRFAQQLGLGIDFVDFTPFNRDHPVPALPRIIMPDQPTQGAKLDEQNRPLPAEALQRAERSRRPRFYPLRKIQRSALRRVHALRNRFLPPAPGRLSASLCAVLIKPE
jgi:2-polyprenyl-3-methyl-5-hydroxy-6-metoxy-1,4-benzoquinol methylase